MSLKGGKNDWHERFIKSPRWAPIVGRFKLIQELFPLTRLGLLVGLVSGLGLWHFGFAKHDLVWYVAALCGLALIVLALITVIAGVFIVRKRITNSTEKVLNKCVTDVPWTSEFVFPSFRFFPLLNLELIWAAPTAHKVDVVFGDNLAHERVSLIEHGNFFEVTRHISLTDVLGLVSLTVRHASPANLEVMPNRGCLANAPWLASLNDGEDLPNPLGAAVGDRLELRRYQAGDPARFIHWKAFARTRKLMQREPERSLSRTRRTAAYLVCGKGDGASAAAALTVLEASALGIDWVFGADGMPGPLESRAEVEAAIRHSASQRDKGGGDLSQFISSVDKGGDFNLMLFVPAIAGEWEDKVHSVLARSNLDCKIVIGVDGLRRKQQRPLLYQRWYQSCYQWVLQPEPVKGFDALDLERLVTRFENAGAGALIADRVSGRLLKRHDLSVKISGNSNTNRKLKKFASKAI